MMDGIMSNMDTPPFVEGAYALHLLSVVLVKGLEEE